MKIPDGFGSPFFSVVFEHKFSFILSIVALSQLHTLQRRQPSAPLKLTTAASSQGHVKKSVCCRGTQAHPSSVRSEGGNRAQGSYLTHVRSFCWINIASIKDQIYPSQPFPLTGHLWGCWWGWGPSLSCPLSSCNLHK